MAKNNKNEDTIAPINIEKLQEFGDIIRKVSFYKTPDNFSKKRTNPATSKYTDRTKEAHQQIKDSLYYMLYNEGVTKLTQRKNGANELIFASLENAARLRGESGAVPNAQKRFEAYEEANKFLNALENGKTGSKTQKHITIYDLETIGYTDEFGNDRIVGVYDYAFAKYSIKRGKLQTDKRSNLIGIAENDETHKALIHIKNKILSRQQLTKIEAATYAQISGLGKAKIVSEGNGLFSYELAGKIEKGDILSFEQGIKNLIDIGNVQKHNGLENFIKDTQEFVTEDTILTGHNIKYFDNPVMRQFLSTPNAKKYLGEEKHKKMMDLFGENGLVLDTRLMPGDGGQEARNEYFSGIYGEHGVPKGLSRNQAEALYIATKRNLGLDVAEELHHSSSVDVKQLAQMLGLEAFEGEKQPRSLMRDYISYLADSDFNKNNDQITINNLEDVYLKFDTNSLASKNSIPFFGVTQKGDSITLSNGISYSLGEKNAISPIKDNNYIPAVFRKNALMKINQVGTFNRENFPEKYEGIKEKYFDFLKTFGQEKYVDEDFVVLDLEEIADEAGRTLLRSESRSRIFVPMSEFSRFTQNLSVVSVNDIETPIGAQQTNNTVPLKRVGQVIQVDEKTKLPARERNQGKMYSTAKENAWRRISGEGSYNSILRGIDFKRIAEGYGVDLKDFQEAFKRAVNGDPTAITGIFSGKDFAQSLESFEFYGFDKEKLVSGKRINLDYLVQEAFKIDGTINRGWIDNSFIAMNHISENSVLGYLAKKINSIENIEQYQRKRIYESSLAIAKDVIEKSDAYKQRIQNNIVYVDKSRFAINLSRFRLSKTQKHIVPEEASKTLVTFDLNNEYAGVNDLMRLYQNLTPEQQGDEVLRVKTVKSLANELLGSKKFVFGDGSNRLSKFYKNFIEELGLPSDKELTLSNFDDTISERISYLYEIGHGKVAEKIKEGSKLAKELLKAKENLQQVVKDEKLDSATLMGIVQHSIKTLDNATGEKYRDTVIDRRLLAKDTQFKNELDGFLSNADIDKEIEGLLDNIVSENTKVVKGITSTERSGTEALSRFMKRGIDVVDEYRKIIEPLRGTEDYNKRVAMIESHNAAINTTAQTIVDHIQRNGGKIEVSGDSVFATIGGTKIDLTNFLPRANVSGGALRYSLGGTDYVAQFVASIGANGNVTYRSNLEVATASMFYSSGGNSSFAQKRFDNNKILGTKKEHTVLAGIFRDFDKFLRMTPAASSIEKDAMLNMQGAFGHNFLTLSGRNQLKRALSNMEITNREDAKYRNILLNFIESHKNEYRVDEDTLNGSVRQSFRMLIEKGYINTEGVIKDSANNIKVNINAGAKETKESHLAFGLSETYYGATAFNYRPLGIEHVTMNTIPLNVEATNERIKKIYGNDERTVSNIPGKERIEIATKHDLVFGKQVSGIKLDKKIHIARLEADLKVKSHIIKAIKDLKKDSSVVDKIFFGVNTFEGGGWISSKTVDAIGTVGGTRVISLKNKEIMNESRLGSLQSHFKYIKDESGAIKDFEFSYGKGYLVREGEQIINSYNTFKNDYEDFIAKRASIVKNKFFVGKSGKSLTESQVKKLILKTINERNEELSEKTIYAALGQLMSSDIEEKIEATPLFHNGLLKGITGEMEKSELYIGIGTLDDAKKDGIENILNSEAFTKINDHLSKFYDHSTGRTTGASKVDIRVEQLSYEIFEDIKNLNFSSPIFSPLKGKDKRKLKEQIIEEVGSIEKWQEILENARHRQANLIAQAMGESVDVITQSKASSIKHKHFSTDIENLFNHIYRKNMETVKDKDRALWASINEFASFAKKKDGTPLNHSDIYFDKDAEKVIIPSDGEFVFDAKKLLEKMEEFDKETLGKNLIVADTFSEIIDNSNFNKPGKFGTREINALLNGVYDQDEIDKTREIIGDKKFKKLFGDIVQQIDDKYTLKKEYIGRSVWGNALTSIFQNAYRTEKGEIIYEQDAIDRWGENSIQHKSFKAINQLTDAVDSGMVEHKAVWESGLGAFKYLDENDESKRKEILEKYNFSKGTIEDITPKEHMSYGNINQSSWNKNMVIDLKDDSIGLNESFFSNRSMRSELVLPFNSPTPISNYDSYGLKEYQNKALEIRNTVQELKSLYNKSDAMDKDTFEATKSKLQEKFAWQVNSYYKEMNKYFNTTKEQGLTFDQLDIRMRNAVRNRTQVLDVSSFDDKNLIGTLRKFEYDGKALPEYFKKVNGKAQRHIGFAVLSTKDLDRFGFNDQYFQRLADKAGEDVSKIKEIWLNTAKTKGIQGLVNRAPSDYLGSTSAVQLYFSDDVNRGVTIVDSITAALMKNDSDGDHIIAMALGVHNERGEFIDNIAKNMGILTNMSEKTKESFDIIEQAHNRSMAINSVIYSKIADIASTTKDDLDNIEIKNGVARASQKYLEKLKKEREEAYKENTVFGSLYSTNVSNISLAKQSELYEKWDNAKQYLNEYYGKVIDGSFGKAATESQIDFANKWLNSSDEEKYILSKDINKEDLVSYYGNDSEIVQEIEQGIIANNRLVEPGMQHIIKGMRSQIGVLDTPLFVLDTLRTSLANSDMDSALKLTARESDSLNYIRESIKEGYLTSKQADISNIKAKEGLPSRVRQLFDIAFIGKSSEKEMNAAKNELTDLVLEHGRNVAKRFGFGENVSKEAHREFIEEGFNVIFNKMLPMVNPNLRGSSYNMARYLVAAGINDYRNGKVSNTVSPIAVFANRARVSLYEDDEKTIQGIFQESKSKIDALSDDEINKYIDRNRKLSKNVYDSKIVPYDSKIISSVSRAVSNFGWSKAAAAIAGSIMFTGWMGGNPSEPVGEEASKYSEEPQNTYQRIPKLSDSNLSASRNAPKQGYIININAQNKDNNEYARDVISHAVRNYYQNSHINISMNVNEQTEINSDALYNYFANSL